MSDSSPIIVVGMHRSGTTLVSKILQRVGVFMGSRRDPNEESIFFIRFNEWLLRQAGGDWNYPEPMNQAMEDPETKAVILGLLRTAVSSPLAYRYLGATRYFWHRSLTRLDFPWGWKDPRNAFTLPAWLEVFPRAKIIYVIRHGVDVAISLSERSRIETKKSARRLSSRLATFGWLFGLTQFRSNCQSGRFLHLTMDDAFRLWSMYNKNIRIFLSTVDCPVLSIKYEDLLANPLENLRKLAEFSGSSLGENASMQLPHMMDQSRAFAYQHDQSLVAFAQQHKSALAAHGYS